MKKYLIVIKADTNDADYIEETNQASEDEYNVIKKVAKIISEFVPYEAELDGMTWTHDYNYPKGELIRTDLGQKSAEDYYLESGLLTKSEFYTFDSFVPHHEYGVHSIESVKAYEYISEKELL